MPQGARRSVFFSGACFYRNRNDTFAGETEGVDSEGKAPRRRYESEKTRFGKGTEQAGHRADRLPHESGGGCNRVGPAAGRVSAVPYLVSFPFHPFRQETFSLKRLFR